MTQSWHLVEGERALGFPSLPRDALRSLPIDMVLFPSEVTCRLSAAQLMLGGEVNRGTLAMRAFLVTFVAPVPVARCQQLASQPWWRTMSSEGWILRSLKRQQYRWSCLVQLGQSLVNTPNRIIGVHYSCTDGVSNLGFLLSGMSELQSRVRQVSWTPGPEAAARFGFQLFPGSLTPSLPELDCWVQEGNNTS